MSKFADLIRKVLPEYRSKAELRTELSHACTSRDKTNRLLDDALDILVTLDMDPKGKELIDQILLAPEVKTHTSTGKPRSVMDIAGDLLVVSFMSEYAGREFMRERIDKAAWISHNVRKVRQELESKTLKGKNNGICSTVLQP